ncbi:MAG TPA: hypothetical protein VIN08_09150 [Ohtaekwangia sp.]|uniref:hypothetical protein n=1 Tax=Ohtaekwangia sp. TaxID=2066019 RepID=UPI002F941665
MRIILLLLITLAMYPARGQSPFNYGKDKQVYFLGLDDPMRLGIDIIYIVDQRSEEDRGGMDENWSVTTYSFASESIEVNWAPLSKPTNFRYNFDSLTSHPDYLNGRRYELSGIQLKAYGGEGYGTFDWQEITPVNDTLSIVASMCVGHCYNQPIVYSKNVFNKGRITRIITYPHAPADSTETLLPENTDEYEAYFSSLLAYGDPDTLNYYYNAKGLLLNIGKTDQHDDTNKQIKSFKDGVGSTSYKFHQCYIGRIPMEKFLKKKLGFMPELFLIEIYQYGVFSFILREKKYYPGETVVLER